MRKSRFTEEQIAYALRRAKQGTAVAELCRAELRKVKQLAGKVRRLKQLVADLTLDKQMLQQALATCRSTGKDTTALRARLREVAEARRLGTRVKTASLGLNQLISLAAPGAQ